MFKKIAILLIVVLTILLVVFIVIYSFYKYKSTLEGGGTADIAKWIFNGSFEEQLSEIKLSNTVQKSSLLNGKIAPGTKGKFKIVINATGTEVGVDYSAKVIEEINKPENMIFKIKGADKKYNSLESLVLSEVKGTIKIDDKVKVVEIPIEWEWPYESFSEESDLVDTDDGQNKLTYSFKINIIGKQIS